MTVVGEKLGTDPRIGQSACYGLGWEPFFSGAVDLLNSIDDSRKVATYRDYPQEVYECRTWTGTKNIRIMCIRFSLQGVHRFESPRLSDLIYHLCVSVST
jgi:hypothetical protein